MEASDGKQLVMVEAMSSAKRVQFVVVTMALLGLSCFLSIAGPMATQEVSAMGDVTALDLAERHEEGFSTAIKFNNLYTNTLELWMEVTPEEGELQSVTFSKDVMLQVNWTGITEEGVKSERSDVVRRQVLCHMKDEEAQLYTCNKVLIFRDMFMTHKTFQGSVRILPEHRAAAAFIKDVRLFWAYENIKFAIWGIRLNYLCFGLAAVVAVWWFYVCRVDGMRRRANDDAPHASRRSLAGLGALGKCCCCCGTDDEGTSKCCPYRGRNQRWIAALLISVIGFNSPFMGAQYADNEGLVAFFMSVDTVLQIAFTTVLLVFWVSAFERIYMTEESKPVMFWLKFAYFGAFFVCASVLYSEIAMRKAHDLFYDWSADQTIWRPLVRFAVFYGISYSFWIFFVTLRAAGRLAALPASLKMVFFLHVVHIIVAVAGLLIGALYAEDVRHSRLHFLFQFSLNFYVLELAYLFQPVTSQPVTLDDAAHGLGAVEDSNAAQVEFSTMQRREGGAKPPADSMTNVNLSLV